MTVTVVSILMAMGNLIPLILSFMAAVETELNSGTGPDKKAAVMAGVKAVINDETVWTKMQTLFSGIIDILARFHFGAKT